MSARNPDPHSLPLSRSGPKGFGPIPRWHETHAIVDLPRIRAQLKQAALGPLSAYNPALDWLTKHQVTLV